MEWAKLMLKISLLPICAFKDSMNHRPYDFYLILDHVSQISRRLTIHLLLKFWKIRSSSRRVMLCSLAEMLCDGFNDRFCEYPFYWYWAQAPIFSDWSSLLCPDHRKNQDLMALEVIVDIWEACALKKSEGQLKCLNVSLTFACC